MKEKNWKPLLIAYRHWIVARRETVQSRLKSSRVKNHRTEKEKLKELINLIPNTEDLDKTDNGKTLIALANKLNPDVALGNMITWDTSECDKLTLEKRLVSLIEFEFNKRENKNDKERPLKKCLGCNESFSPTSTQQTYCKACGTPAERTKRSKNRKR